jgi:hypothetical protein
MVGNRLLARYQIAETGLVKRGLNYSYNCSFKQEIKQCHCGLVLKKQTNKQNQPQVNSSQDPIRLLNK